MADKDRAGHPNTYAIKPHFRKKFQPMKVEEIIKAELTEKLENQKYHVDKAAKQAKEITDGVKKKLKGGTSGRSATPLPPFPASALRSPAPRSAANGCPQASPRLAAAPASMHSRLLCPEAVLPPCLLEQRCAARREHAATVCLLTMLARCCRVGVGSI